MSKLIEAVLFGKHVPLTSVSKKEMTFKTNKIAKFEEKKKNQKKNLANSINIGGSDSKASQKLRARLDKTKAKLDKKIVGAKKLGDVASTVQDKKLTKQAKRIVNKPRVAKKYEASSKISDDLKNKIKEYKNGTAKSYGIDSAKETFKLAANLSTSGVASKVNDIRDSFNNRKVNKMKKNQANKVLADRAIKAFDKRKQKETTSPESQITTGPQTGITL